MGLFTQTQIDQINRVAKKSQSVSAPAPSKKATSINDEIIAASNSVKEYFKDSEAILITTKQELHEYIDKVIESGYCGIDTETTGLDRNRDYIIGASLYYPGGVECYIPMKHRIPIFEDFYKNQLSYEDVCDEFSRFANKECKLIFANANFDLYMIWKDLKVDLCKSFYYDVILAWRCLKENELHNGLKELYNKYPLHGKGDPKKFSDFFSPKLFSYCKPEIAKLYAANDAKITYELFQWQLPYTVKTHPKCQKNQLEHISDLIWQVEFPLEGTYDARVSVFYRSPYTGTLYEKDTVATAVIKVSQDAGVEDESIPKVQLRKDGPCSDCYRVESSVPVEQVSVFSMDGRCMLDGRSGKIDLSSCPSGLYIVSVKVQGTPPTSFKLVCQ